MTTPKNLVVSYSESGVGQANESYQIPTQVMRALRTLTFNSQCTTIFTIMKRLEKIVIAKSYFQETN